MTPERPLRVLLADDEHLIRGALAALLALEEDLVVVAEAASGPEALAMALAHRPDVAVLDLQMPGADGVKVATSLRAELPDCRTMIVTSHGRPGHLKRALAAGVRGFVPKTVWRVAVRFPGSRARTAAISSTEAYRAITVTG
ncbi:response regulator, partial [Streptomyces globisporus]